jgi:hypothetical protein
LIRAVQAVQAALSTQPLKPGLQGKQGNKVKKNTHLTSKSFAQEKLSTKVTISLFGIIFMRQQMILLLILLLNFSVV